MTDGDAAVRISLHTGPTPPSDTGSPRQEASWASASAGEQTLTHMLVGGDVYERVEGGEWRRVGNSWCVHIGSTGGALEVGDA